MVVTALVKPGVSDKVLDQIQQTVQHVVQQLAQNNVLPPGQYKVNIVG
jgi:hypothetical protein